MVQTKGCLKRTRNISLNKKKKKNIFSILFFFLLLTNDFEIVKVYLLIILVGDPQHLITWHGHNERKSFIPDCYERS